VSVAYTIAKRATWWLAIALLTWVSYQPVSAGASAPRVAIVIGQDSPLYAEVVEGFRAYLTGVGVAAKIDVYNLKGNSENAQDVLGKLKDDRPRMFFTIGPLATQTVLAESGEVPVIASLTGHLDNLRKKGNLTGVGLEFSLETQFEVMRRIVPDLANIGVLFSPKENREMVDLAWSIANKLGMTLVPKPIEAPRQIPDALDSLANNVDLLWGVTDQGVLTPQTAEPILLFSFRNTIPFAGLSASWVKAGSLYALERDYGDIGSQCGEVAVKVLNNQPPRTIPVAYPRKVLYAINLKTARHMKMELSQKVIEGASQVFQ
jgi:putative tryptophan/tyrosine transport system substrate-binding protein